MNIPHDTNFPQPPKKKQGTICFSAHKNKYRYVESSRGSSIRSTLKHVFDTTLQTTDENKKLMRVDSFPRSFSGSHDSRTSHKRGIKRHLSKEELPRRNLLSHGVAQVIS